MKNISEILLKYQTDKNMGQINGIGHYYGGTYQTIFNNFNENDKLNILEVGIQKGGSLCAWKEYFNNASIYGVDIIDVMLDEYRNSEFNYFISDIKSDFSKEKLSNIGFDIIIDDGSHDFNDILFLVNNYLSELNLNGYMIIEDCQHDGWFPHIKNMLNPEQYDVTLFDTRPLSKCGDDMVTVIKRIK
jgi:hypothetical protein